MSVIATYDKDSVRYVVLSRAEARNAFNMDLIHGLSDSLRQAAYDESVRCVVLKGEGPVFSAGIDLNLLHELAGAPQTLPAFRRTWIEMATLAEQMPKPVIAQLHGACLGGALEMVLACDIRIAEESTRFQLLETRNGVVPDGGGCARLPAVVGVGRAKELILACRAITGRRAEQIGLVNEAVPATDLDSAVQRFLDDLLRCKSVAVGLAKRVIDSATRPTLSAALDQELMAQELAFTSEEFLVLAREVSR
jgi:enoyl-CoA hydratase/carnithine racemase